MVIQFCIWFLKHSLIHLSVVRRDMNCSEWASPKDRAQILKKGMNVYWKCVSLFSLFPQPNYMLFSIIIPHVKIVSRDCLTKVGYSIMSPGEMSTGKTSTILTGSTGSHCCFLHFDALSNWCAPDFYQHRTYNGQNVQIYI